MMLARTVFLVAFLLVVTLALLSNSPVWRQGGVSERYKSNPVVAVETTVPVIVVPPVPAKQEDRTNTVGMAIIVVVITSLVVAGFGRGRKVIKFIFGSTLRLGIILALTLLVLTVWSIAFSDVNFGALNGIGTFLIIFVIVRIARR